MRLCGRKRRPRRGSTSVAIAVLAGLAAGLLPAGAARGQASWRLEHPPPPPGAVFRVPLGKPGDLQCWGRNRCLLTVEGNATVSQGIYVWNGQSWRLLSTVCGGPGETSRIAFAGPADFWTITVPSRPRSGAGRSLCHFVNGKVVASYSTPESAADPFRTMFAAACFAPDNCWFGGVGSQDATGERVGAYHLHWDGTGLRTVYGPQGRGVTDMEAFGGTMFESVVVGRAPENRQDSVNLAQPETPGPRLLHRILGESFANEPFLPADRAGVPPDGTDLLGLDSDGAQLWAVGGGAASGPSAPLETSVARPPIALRFENGAWRELGLDPALFGATDRFVDVAAVPGTASAWAAVQPYAERGSVNAEAKVALMNPDGSAAVMPVPPSGSGRGAAARIAFTDPNDGWLVTTAGWIFHWTDGSSPPVDTDPAFAGTITFRPNEAAEQFIPDRPLADDNQTFVPPPLQIQQQPVTKTEAGKKLPPLLRDVKTQLRGRTLIVSFRLVRAAKVGLSALRKRKVVARIKPRNLKPGKRRLTVRLDPRRFPTRLKFSVKEKGVTDDGGGDDGNTVGT